MVRFANASHGGAHGLKLIFFILRLALKLGPLLARDSSARRAKKPASTHGSGAPTTWVPGLLVGAGIVILVIVIALVVDFQTERENTPHYPVVAGREEALALTRQADAYRTGQDVEQDYAQAARLYRQAAGKGLAEAQFRLGEMFAREQGVPNDQLRACMWFTLAAAQTRTGASDCRDKLDISENQIAEAGRMAKDWLAEHPQAR